MVFLLSTVTVLASAVTRYIRVTYRDIGLVVNGEAVTLYNIAGESVEPFIFEGMVFVPVCAMGEVLGLDVNWDGRTSTVAVTSPDAPVNFSWLDHMPHLNHQINGTGRFAIVSWIPRNHYRNSAGFERGLTFYASRESGGRIDGYQRIDISLNAVYNYFVGTLIENTGLGRSQIRIYGDGNPLFVSPILSQGTIPIPFNINVSGILLLQIQVIPLDRRETHAISLVDARFEQH